MIEGYLSTYCTGDVGPIYRISVARGLRGAPGRCVICMPVPFSCAARAALRLMRRGDCDKAICDRNPLPVLRPLRRRWFVTRVPTLPTVPPPAKKCPESSAHRWERVCLSWLWALGDEDIVPRSRAVHSVLDGWPWLTHGTSPATSCYIDRCLAWSALGADRHQHHRPAPAPAPPTPSCPASLTLGPEAARMRVSCASRINRKQRRSRFW